MWRLNIGLRGWQTSCFIVELFFPLCTPEILRKVFHFSFACSLSTIHLIVLGDNPYLAQWYHEELPKWQLCNLLISSTLLTDLLYSSFTSLVNFLWALSHYIQPIILLVLKTAPHYHTAYAHVDFWPMVNPRFLCYTYTQLAMPRYSVASSHLQPRWIIAHNMTGVIPIHWLFWLVTTRAHAIENSALFFSTLNGVAIQCGRSFIC